MQVLSQVDHPGICPVFGVGEVGGRPYIAMDFLEGETLADKLDRQRSSESGKVGVSSRGTSTGLASRSDLMAVVHRVEQAARGLHAVHEAGLIHRDVKPDNIMIRQNGDPVLLDFGLAREAGPDPSTLTSTGDILGTPAYMSPEQIEPMGEGIDHRTDIYSLGATLYECLTLETPFQGTTRDAFYRQILFSEIRNPIWLNRHIPRGLRVVIETAIDRESGLWEFGHPESGSIPVRQGRYPGRLQTHCTGGNLSPNRFGLHEVIGNVEEWCLDRIAPYSRPVLPGTG